MAKDPAFLFYPKDWLEGTADLSPEAKGIYIDFLCYQHQRGSLPVEPKKLARLARLSAQEFTEIWAEISEKFEEKNGFLVNEKLNDVSNQRELIAKQKRISGIFGTILRQSNLKKREKEQAKQEFNVSEFMHIETTRLTTCITTWLTTRFDFVAIAIANKDIDKDINIVYPFDSENFKKWWGIWKEYKSKEHSFKYKTNLSEQAALKKLSELSRGSEQTAIKIIEQSIALGWKGFFPLSQSNNSSTQQSYENLKRKFQQETAG